MDFVNCEPDEILSIDLNGLSPTEVRRLAYYIWLWFPDDERLMTWRQEKVLPLVSVLNLVDPEDFGDEDF